MSWHEFLDEDLRERAALFVLGDLAGDDERLYRLHLAGCDVCRAEVESLARTARALTRAAPAVQPAPELWERVLARIRRAPGAATPDAGNARAQVWQEWTPDVPAPSGFAFAAGGAPFEPTGFPGVEARRLYVDAANDRVTMLVRMAPGSSYPGHRHGGPEECFVLEGDLRVGDLRMRAGDYQRADAGSRHGLQSTEGGCVLLLVSSLRDELL